MVLNAIKSLKTGHTLVMYENEKYGVTRTDFNNGKSIKIYAEQLSGTNFISVNIYKVTNKILIKPCEMPEAKVLHFFNNFKLIKEADDQ